MALAGLACGEKHVSLVEVRKVESGRRAVICGSGEEDVDFEVL
jgi:hypothetical protein